MRPRLQTSVLVVLLIAGPASAQTAEPPEPAPTGVQIHLLNPSTAYNPATDPTGGSDSPGISDRDDGTDSLYRIAAWTQEAPGSARVEVSYGSGDAATFIGEMTRSEASADAWLLLWDVPDDVPAGATPITVSLKEGDQELASDEVAARLSHRPADGPALTDPPPDQSVSVTWPAMGGRLGFFRNTGDPWSTVIDGTTSEGTRQIQAFYSKSVVGALPEFVFCGLVPTQVSAAPFPVQVPCQLQSEDQPDQVTAVGLVSQATLDQFGQTASQGLTQESADVVRASGRVQRVNEFTVDMNGFGRALPNRCATFTVSVTDRDGRPVQGANLDVHLSGPEGSSFAAGSQNSGSKAPDQGQHEAAPAVDCAGSAAGEQGFHSAQEVPRPTSHRESTDGSGLSGPDGIGPGQWRFDVHSPEVGFADVTVWLDEPRSGKGPDDDVQGARESSVTARAQWLPEAPSITIDPVAGSAETSAGCVPFLARARAGDVAVPGINVNIDASGPGAAPSFCEPEGSAELRQVERAPEPDQVVPVRGVESETDARGNLIFGLSSTAGGDTTLDAWLDGETGQDDDIQGAAEAADSTTFSWGGVPEDVKLSFIDPSPYGAGSTGAGSGVQVPMSGKVTVAVRASAPSLVDEIELLLSSDGGTNFYEIGTLTRVPDSDVFSYLWTGRLTRGSHVLRAQIPGTEALTDLAIQAGPPAQPVELSSKALEVAGIRSPALGSRVPFREGATMVAGTASPGAEGVDLFYTTASAQATPPADGWVFCGYVDLDGLGQEPQAFEGACTLAEEDKPWKVTGLAAIAVDCTTTDGCNPDPTAGGPLGRGADKDAGDAVRVYGYEDNPLLTFAGLGEGSRRGPCRRFAVLTSDAVGEPIPNQSFELFVRGRNVSFCRRPGSSVAGGAGRLSLISLIDGSAAVGIRSRSRGASQITVWFDRNGDGRPGDDEGAVMHPFEWRK